MIYPQPVLSPAVGRLVRIFDRHCFAYGDDRVAAAGAAAVALLDDLEAAREAGELPLGWQGPAFRMWAFPDRSSWLRTRKLLGTVGGSDVGPIVYGTYDGLWGFARPDLRKMNDSMSEGHWWESTILRRYAYTTGAQLVDLPEHTIHLRWGWAHVSVDALARPVDDARYGATTVVDAKWVFRVDAEDSRAEYDLEHHIWGQSCDVDPEAHYGDLPMPPYILGQALLLMAVLDLGTCDIAALLPSYQLRVYTVWRSETRERAVLSLCRQAWERYRLRGEMPPASENDVCLAWYREQRRRRDRGVRVAAADEVALVVDLAQARAARKAAVKREKALRAEVIQTMGMHSRLDVAVPGKEEGQKLLTVDRRNAVRLSKAATTLAANTTEEE